MSKRKVHKMINSIFGKQHNMCDGTYRGDSHRFWSAVTCLKCLAKRGKEKK